jgi:hypothetical protein
MSETKKKYKEFRIYKPRNDGSGAASAFQLRSTTDPERIPQRELNLFLSMTNQTGYDKENDNALFGWQEDGKNITMKLGPPDVGDMLLVLSGRKEYVGPSKKADRQVESGLYHANPKGNTVLRLKRAKNQSGEVVYYMQLSAQRDGKQTMIKHSLTAGEGELLRLLLINYIENLYGWQY